MLDREAFNPSPCATNSRIGRPFLLCHGVNLHHRVAKVSEPGNSCEPVERVCDQMRGGDWVCGPNYAWPMLPDQFESRRHGSNEPTHPLIRQSHPAEVASLKRQMD